MWKVEPWYISGVLTGYRVIRRGVRGYWIVDSSYVWDCYGPTPLHEYRVQAETRCKELNESYDAPNVIQLHGDRHG